ncbi:DUF481 domain-containing protein [Emcibacter sp. SYSU 3D8]|uniref:DUF481 domain-containing protein n=1 Tax=Emcibacter sp. SYSU 3D8 TaxID=3133969 RepID=UPI0031FEBA88
MQRGLAFLAAIQFMAPVAAMAQEAKLPDGVAVMLRKAADRDIQENTSRYLETAVVIAADGYPNLRGEILAEAGRLAPGRTGAVTAAVANRQMPASATPAPEPQAAVSVPTPPTPPAKKPVPPKPSGFAGFDNWTGNVELGASLNSGNISSQSIVAALSLLNDRHKWRHKLGASFGLLRTSGTTTKEQAAAKYQLDYKWSDRLYNFGLVEYERDKYGAFRERFLESIGVGYRALEGETYSLDIEAGAAVRQSTPTATMISQTEYGGRLNTVFNWDVSDTFSIINTGSVFLSDRRTSLEDTVAFKTKITETISGKLSFNVKHDTDVPLGNAKTSTETKATLLYSF